MTDLPPYLAALNEEQRAAAMAADGPVLIVAGAGSGKTRLLIARIRCLIERGVEPGEVLAVTFTRKAADEMRGRLRKEMGGSIDAMTIGTYHAVGAELQALDRAPPPDPVEDVPDDMRTGPGRSPPPRPGPGRRLP